MKAYAQCQRPHNVWNSISNLSMPPPSLCIRLLKLWERGYYKWDFHKMSSLFLFYSLTWRRPHSLVVEYLDSWGESWTRLERICWSVLRPSLQFFSRITSSNVTSINQLWEAGNNNFTLQAREIKFYFSFFKSKKKFLRTNKIGGIFKCQTIGRIGFFINHWISQLK